MKLIPLTQGKFAMVDDEDYDRVMQFKWRAERRRKTFYAVRTIHVAGRRASLWMHAFIMNTPIGHEVHHINENGLDNRRSENLQVVTRAEHERLGGRQTNNTSGFRGVYWFKGRNLWRAEITSHGKHMFVGHYRHIEEAAHARDVKARELGWPEAGMNFPKTS